MKLDPSKILNWTIKKTIPNPPPVSLFTHPSLCEITSLFSAMSFLLYLFPSLILQVIAYCTAPSHTFSILLPKYYSNTRERCSVNFYILLNLLKVPKYFLTFTTLKSFNVFFSTSTNYSSHVVYLTRHIFLKVIYEFSIFTMTRSQCDKIKKLKK